MYFKCVFKISLRYLCAVEVPVSISAFLQPYFGTLDSISCHRRTKAHKSFAKFLRKTIEVYGSSERRRLRASSMHRSTAIANLCVKRRYIMLYQFIRKFIKLCIEIPLGTIYTSNGDRIH